MRYLPFFLLFLLVSCGSNDDDTQYQTISSPNVTAAFGNNINLNQLSNYAQQFVPPYITRTNAPAASITDKGATLGRVLFYDKKLSSNNTVSCATCHIQAQAFGDTNVASNGVNGLTQRHTMRLINTRFATESKFFWDERAPNLQAQVTMPIRNHGEMGYSGTDGDDNFDDLIAKISEVGYYKELFQFVYGSPEITEAKMQLALSQFVNSIQSFDSKYDAGRALVAQENQPFPNFSLLENQGKNLYNAPPQFDNQGKRTGGGVGCAGCHAAPEFDIIPDSSNNGIIGILNAPGIDVTNTRAPSLRDIVKRDGTLNAPLMHTGVITSLVTLLGHYNDINRAPGNGNLDPRLRPNGFGQQLRLTDQETDALIAFLKTTAGTNVYIDPKWSNPFLD